MNIPNDLLFAASHEWVRVEPDGTLTVGISDFAQEQLGELVFLEVPEAGRELMAAEPCAVVESVKAASDINAPLDGEVVEGNGALADAPDRINKDPYGAWIFRMRPSDPAALATLMDAAAYRASLQATGTGP